MPSLARAFLARLAFNFGVVKSSECVNTPYTVERNL
jgi:hypothetical protein